MDLLQVALHAEDFDRTSAFWSALLGRSEAARFDPPGLLFFTVGGTRLLFEREVPAALVYLTVPDLAAALAALPEGASEVTGPQRIFVHPDDALGPAGAEEWHASFRDPSGNGVVLVELRGSGYPAPEGVFPPDPAAEPPGSPDPGSIS